jgi:hypothetical protein
VQERVGASCVVSVMAACKRKKIQEEEKGEEEIEERRAGKIKNKREQESQEKTDEKRRKDRYEYNKRPSYLYCSQKSLHCHYPSTTPTERKRVRNKNIQ